jgi:hypothetical protein
MAAALARCSERVLPLHGSRAKGLDNVASLLTMMCGYVYRLRFAKASRSCGIVSETRGSR